MADVDDRAEVTFDIDASEAFQALCQGFFKLRTLYETLAVSQDRLQNEQLANRALVKQLVERNQRQDDRIAVLTRLVDSHQAALEMAIPPAGRGHDA
jgi:hypothetical protein